MLKILWKRGDIAPEEQFLLLFTIYCYLMLDFCVKTRIRFSLRDKRLFEITEVEMTKVDCTLIFNVLRSLFAVCIIIFLSSFSRFLYSSFWVTALILEGNFRRDFNPKQRTYQPFRGNNFKLIKSGMTLEFF